MYHDEFDFLSPAVAVLDGQPPAVLPFSSTPALTEAFGAEWRLVPGLSAGFHVALAVWFKVLGVGIWQARLFVYLAGVAVVALVFALGTRWFNVWVGAAAALLLALDGTFWLASRQVRPETFTILTYLGAAYLLSLPDRRWRDRVPELAGAIAGVGLAGHPVGVVALPVVLAVPFAATRPWPTRRFLVRLAWPIVVIGAAYGAFLAWHWDGVHANLELHRAHRLLGPLGLLDRVAKEWRRYGEGYWNAYTLSLGATMTRAAFGGWAVLALGAVARRGRSYEALSSRAALLFAATPAVVMAGMAVLARDNNFIYLPNVLVWLYLSAAAGAALAGRALARFIRWPMATPVAGWLLLVIVATTGVRQYAAEAAPYTERAILPYERLERIVAAHLPRGAFVLATETAWLATRAAGAEFVFNRHYLQLLPPYRRYPVRAAFEGGSHLVDYAVDISLLEEVRARGREVFYLSDMWDWSWNVYAPFGRYAGSFLGLQATLDRSFVPVLRLYTRDRGFVSLYRLDGSRSGPRGEPALFVEDSPHRTGRQITGEGLEPRAQLRVDNPGAGTTVARFPVEPGQAYWLHLELAVLDGHAVVPLWDGVALPKHVDARVPVSVDGVIYPTRASGTLSLLAYPDAAVVSIERVTLTKLVPVR